MERPEKIIIFAVGLFAAAALAAGYIEEGTEAESVTLPVVSDGSGMSAFTTADGCQVEIKHLLVAVSDLEFTVSGETHGRLLDKIEKLLIPKAYAHPGHLAGGEVTGELTGNFLLSPTRGDDLRIGDATLLEGEYHGMNLTFRKATAEDKTFPDDPIVGHTIRVEGTAMKDGGSYDFFALVDIDENTKMVGAPFTLNLDASDPGWTLDVKILSQDPSTEGDTLFDGIDFAGLDENQDGNIRILPGDAAHNILKRRFQVHDHYWVEPRR